MVKKPSTQPPKQDAYMVVLSRAVPRSCPCPIGAAKFPPPTRRSERRNPFNPRLRRPCMAGRRTDKYFSKSSRGGVDKTVTIIRDFTTTPQPIPNFFLVVYLLKLSSECLVSYDPHFPGNDGTNKQARPTLGVCFLSQPYFVVSGTTRNLLGIPRH